MVNIIKYGEVNWIDAFCDYLLKNEPCILSKEFTDEWLARKMWVNADGSPNYDYLKKKYGECIIPVLSTDSCNYENVRLEQYLDSIITGVNAGESYLKDWHFQSEVMGEPVYDLPLFLQLDWVNQEKWTSDKTNPFGGDYRFVYIGAKGTWTKFHCDVMNTYSWSANICGRKLWYLMQPGAEKQFIKHRQLAEDIREHREKWQDAGVIEFVQEPGQIVFVPSMWHHQEDAISINHNVINSYNVDFIIDLMRSRLVDVIREIEDVRPILSKEEFEEKCQLILNVDIRIDFAKFQRFMNMVIEDRSRSAPSCYVCPKHACVFECKKNDGCIERIRKEMKKSCRCDNYTSLCHDCTLFIKSFEISSAVHTLWSLSHDDSSG